MWHCFVTEGRRERERENLTTCVCEGPDAQQSQKSVYLKYPLNRMSHMIMNFCIFIGHSNFMTSLDEACLFMHRTYSPAILSVLGLMVTDKLFLIKKNQERCIHFPQH